MPYHFNKISTTSQDKIEMSTITIPSAIAKPVVFHVPYKYIALFNISEQNRTYTNVIFGVDIL